VHLWDESAPAFRPGLEAGSGQVAWFPFHFKNRPSTPWRTVSPVPAAWANILWLDSSNIFDSREQHFHHWDFSNGFLNRLMIELVKAIQG
jgi:hypothetical protein